MSHAVMRGQPNAAQMYLDTILDAVLEEDKVANREARGRERVNLAEVIFYSMRLKPASVRIISGATGEKFTNEQILKRAVRLARALIAKGAKGKTIIIVMRNHEHLVSLYYGALFAGVTLFLLEPSSTPYELQYFFDLGTPYLVFCDNDRLVDVTTAVRHAAQTPHGVVAEEGLGEFAAGMIDDIDSFVISDAAPEDVAVMLPTSGSTGRAKAALISHEGLLVHLPSLWSYHSQFPRPTEIAMFLSTAQWMTHTNLLTACPVYDVTNLVTSKKSLEHIIEIIEKHRPTWMLLIPGFATMLSAPIQPHQLTSVETLLITGAPPAPTTLKTLREKLPKSALLCNSYGMTEAQGFSAIPDRQTPLGSPGKLFNIFLYKLIDDNGKEVTECNQNGELYLKGPSIIKGYHNNEEAFLEGAAEGGWWKTGDVFHRDVNDNMIFVERKKFWFKYLNHQISPEELESLISSVPGVQDCVVCGSEAGAATAVVVRPGCNISRDQIRQSLSALSEYKQLRAGVAFVESLPKTYSGKLHRTNCNKYVSELIEKGLCY